MLVNVNKVSCWFDFDKNQYTNNVLSKIISQQSFRNPCVKVSKQIIFPHIWGKKKQLKVFMFYVSSTPYRVMKFITFYQKYVSQILLYVFNYIIYFEL